MWWESAFVIHNICYTYITFVVHNICCRYITFVIHLLVRLIELSVTPKQKITGSYPRQGIRF
jgi:hypothetical protein